MRVYTQQLCAQFCNFLAGSVQLRLQLRPSTSVRACQLQAEPHHENCMRLACSRCWSPPWCWPLKREHLEYDGFAMPPCQPGSQNEVLTLSWERLLQGSPRAAPRRGPGEICTMPSETSWGSPKLGVPYWAPCYMGILLFGGLYWGFLMS